MNQLPTLLPMGWMCVCVCDCVWVRWMRNQERQRQQSSAARLVQTHTQKDTRTHAQSVSQGRVRASLRGWRPNADWYPTGKGPATATTTTAQEQSVTRRRRTTATTTMPALCIARSVSRGRLWTWDGRNERRGGRHFNLKRTRRSLSAN